MAPFTISSHHPLPYRCVSPHAALMKSKKSPEPLSGSPGANEDQLFTHYLRTSIVKIGVRLWRVVRRVMNFCMSVTELLGSKMFFMSVGKNMPMTGELKKKRSLEALERPGCKIRAPEMMVKDPEMMVMDPEMMLMDPEMKVMGPEMKVMDPEMKVVKELDDDESSADERESSVIDSDEEEDDEARRSEWESDEETDEEEDEEDREPEDEESGWSDEDDEGSEASAESLELWQSFLNRADPYNPLSFCSSISSRTNTQQTQPPPATRPEEPRPDSEKGGKKVRFSDRLTVRPLVAWSFASRASRDGSCWMQMARDRERFRRRAESVETLLKPCLSAAHRAGVYQRLQRQTPS
ncbi:protein phosphatase 1 regulatory subunit 15A isoform X2 [Puntigrus tetrazona]|uniref:protein phosphatase 1 regulatory subunit 15A isoform X2 n=1 Tax=Puntigrus tetrazona TaxID=1606681 RepID=UPI001C891DE5|nr:protein phosphatase 1 regulatory subunit 15A isoform X2 [Puntigrus tetrazona]